MGEPRAPENLPDEPLVRIRPSRGWVPLNLRDLCGSKSKIKFVPYDQAYESGFEDMPRRVPDITRITTMLGYRPSVNLETILRQVIAYYRERLKLGPGERMPALPALASAGS